ncbi:MAG: RICIN domain-containing protein [Ruminococcus sp.]|nr:RICIN domain-containing protein [Ruminococcus sp.]
MKTRLFKKTVSLILSGTLMLTVFPSLTAADFSSDAAAGKTRVSVHDPSIIKNGDTYYVFGSHIDAARTKDLQNWTRFTNGYTRTNNVEFGDLSQNLKKAFAWAGEDLEDCEGGFSVWAPDVIWNPDFRNADGTKGAYVMYFCTTSTYIRSVICFATSKNIEGPYTFGDTLIYSGFTKNDQYVKSSTKNVNKKYTSTNIDELVNSGDITMNDSWFRGDEFNNQLFPNAIDPTIYYGSDGKMYMTYGSWSGGIFTIEINPETGKCIHPKTGKTSDGRMVDSYFGTKIAGGYGKSGEGPFIEYNSDNGYYYLWTTYGGLQANGGYNMRVSRSKNPLGPYVDTAGRPAVLESNTNLDSIGLKVMGNYKFSTLDTAYMAGGHNSVLRDDDGKWYLFYHTRFNNGTEYHEVKVHEMFFNDEGWPVVTPFEFGGDHISEGGYNEADITGDYEYINHGTATNGNVINYQKIKLNSDHTISGDVSGKWEQSADSAAAVITIENQKYSGYFIAAENEKGKKVMSFTAVGNNNQTIWGAKNSEYTGSDRESLRDYTDKNAELVIAYDTIGEKSTAVKLDGSNLISGMPYYITNKNSGLSLDLPEGKLESGTNIQQWDFNKCWAQQWKLISVDEKYFRIVSLGDESKCVAVAESSAADGVNVELQEYKGTDNQLFSLIKTGNYYGIVSKCSGGKGGLDVFEWSTENGGNINQFAYNEYDCQLWKIEPVHPSVTSGYYTMRNLNSGLYIAEKSGSAVQSSALTWNITKQSDGTYILQTADGKTLTVENNSSENGADIVLAEYKGDKSQKFNIQCNKDGTYSLFTVMSDNVRCADVFEISTEDGANICQWEYWGGDGQKFILEAAEEVKTPERITGDVNADGSFDVADIVMLEKYILGAGTLTDWLAGDLYNDGVIDVFDKIKMRKEIIKQ